MSFNFPSFSETGDEVFGHNDTDSAGNPTGGYAQCTVDFQPGPGSKLAFRIDWQDGPVDREGGQKPNGAFVEDILEVCRLRLEHYQKSPFECEENREAIAHINKAMAAMVRRRQDRKDRGVLGQNKL